MPRKTGRRVLLLPSHQHFNAYNAPSLGLYRLQKYLEETGIPAEVHDPLVTSWDRVLEGVKRGDYGIIGISGSHDHMAEDLTLMGELREMVGNRQTLFIAGGQEATYNYKQWLAGGIDVVFLGYAEKSLARAAEVIFEDFDQGRSWLKEMDGVALYDGPDLVVNPAPAMTQEEFEHLTYSQVLKIDIPYRQHWDHIRKDLDGFSVCASTFVPEMARLYTTSHCPNRCGYCSSHSFLSASQSSPAPIRMLTAEQVFDMIRVFIRKYGARGVLFNDDEFLINRKRIDRLTDMVMEAKKGGDIDPGFMLHCQARVTDLLKKGSGQKEVDLEFIAKLREAGFHTLGMGIETFSDRLLKSPSMNKPGYSEDDVIQVLEALLQAGIVPNVFLILFIPEAVEEEVVHTMEMGVRCLEMGGQIVVNPLLYSQPGAPVYGRPDYPMKVDEYRSPATGRKIDIARYFIPQNPRMAKAAAGVWAAVEDEIERFKQTGLWPFGTLPKPVVGLLTFMAAARVIEREDLTSKWEVFLRDLVKNKIPGRAA